MELSGEEIDRYTRQMMMEGWGTGTQAKIKQSTVFIAGAGGLGSPVSIYLAVAGVGNIRICDFDSPDRSNLNRQILHNHNRIGTNKAVSAKRTREELNPHIKVEAFTSRIVGENVDDLVGDSDLILDCMDNFPTRYLLNESAIREKIPLVHGSIWSSPCWAPLQAS
jgi:molybdopterin/thiamine biosynthesis adenylyltransferase